VTYFGLGCLKKVIVMSTQSVDLKKRCRELIQAPTDPHQIVSAGCILPVGTAVLLDRPPQVEGLWREQPIVVRVSPEREVLNLIRHLFNSAALRSNANVDRPRLANAR
jgi:hypothetical protein